MHECHVSLKMSSCTWLCSSSNCTQELNFQRFSFTFETLRPIFKGACLLSLCSCVWLFVTPWTVAHQAPLSMGFSRQEHWSGLLCPPPGCLPHPRIEPTSRKSPALAEGFSTTSTAWEELIWWEKVWRSQWFNTITAYLSFIQSLQ